MITAVADTHAVVWYLYNDKRLSQTAKAFIDTTASQDNQIAFSSITLIEIIYLSEKGRISSEAFSKVAATLKKPQSIFVEVPLNLVVAQVVSLIPWASVPDLPDRIIAATALYLNVPIISRDAKIQTTNLQTIW